MVRAEEESEARASDGAVPADHVPGPRLPSPRQVRPSGEITRQSVEALCFYR